MTLKQLQKEAVQRYFKKTKDKILQKRKEKYELLPDDKKKLLKPKEINIIKINIIQMKNTELKL